MYCFVIKANKNKNKKRTRFIVRTSTIPFGEKKKCSKNDE